ncbi:hypothetical protein, partial [Pueribacillus theae]|uniref:hypothetical protein n=1 Tax=Pueribacillus theae TaxID=2171751 RepID=UPI001980544A
MDRLSDTVNKARQRPLPPAGASLISLSLEVGVLGAGCAVINQNHPCERVVCSTAESLCYWPA